MLDVPNEVAAELAGIGDGVLVALRDRLGCRVNLRGNRLTLEGDDLKVAEARAVVEELVDLVESGQEIGARNDRHGPERDGRGRGRAHDLRGRRLVAPRQADHAEDREPEALRRRDPQLHRHLRDRPRRHRQDVSRDRARGGGAVRAAGRPHHPHAARGGGRRAARLPSGRRARQGRPVHAAAVRRALRHDGSGEAERVHGARHDRGGAARIHARPCTATLERCSDAGRIPTDRESPRGRSRDRLRRSPDTRSRCVPAGNQGGLPSPRAGRRLDAVLWRASLACVHAGGSPPREGRPRARDEGYGRSPPPGSSAPLRAAGHLGARRVRATRCLARPVCTRTPARRRLSHRANHAELHDGRSRAGRSARGLDRRDRATAQGRVRLRPASVADAPE